MSSTRAAVVTAIAARWLFCFLIFPAFLVDFATVGDQYYFDSYREIAAQVLAGNGYRAAPETIACLHRPPVYVGVLMLAFPASETCYLWVQLIHGLLGGLATWLTIEMARSWGLSQKLAVAAGWGVALWPFLIWETKITVPENLLVVWVPGTFAALGRWRSGGSWGWLLAAGLMAGAAALTHALYQLLLPCLLVAVLTTKRRRRLLAAVLLTLTASAVVWPWLVRNERVAGRSVGVATGFGLHYLRGLHSWQSLAEGDYFRDHDQDSASYVDEIMRNAGIDPSDDYRVRSDPEINQFLDERAWEDIRDRPGAFFLRALVRLPVPWIQQQTWQRSLFNALLLMPFVLLSVYGLRQSFRLDLMAPLLALLGLSLASAAIYPEAIPMRYALPLIPLLMFFSVHGGAVLSGRR